MTSPLTPLVFRPIPGTAMTSEPQAAPCGCPPRPRQRGTPIRPPTCSFVPLCRLASRGMNRGRDCQSTQRQTKKMNAADQFEALVSEHYRPLYRFAISLTRSEPDACDLTNKPSTSGRTKVITARTFPRSRPGSTRHSTARSSGATKAGQVSSLRPEESSHELPTFTPALADHMDSSNVVSALAQVDEVFQPAVHSFIWRTTPTGISPPFSKCPWARSNRASPRGIAHLREILCPGGNPPNADAERDFSSALLQERLGKL
jgi:hypothetical protein